MAHEHQPGIGQKIFDGEFEGPDGAFLQGLTQYVGSDRKEEARLAWASTLYSQLTGLLPRVKKLDRVALRLALRDILQLHAQVRYFRQRADEDDIFFQTATAAQCETAGSILHRWSRIPLLGGRSYLQASLSYARKAYETPELVGGHTRALAALLLADIYGGYSGGDYLNNAVRLAARIENPDYRSRVYRGAALVAFRRTDGDLAAEYLIDQALQVEGVSRDVANKNEAARKHIYGEQ